MVQNYIVDKLTLSDLKENGKVIIPTFQRGIVWSLQHRKEFIETVKSGDPFGVVLVSQENPTDPYYLIDGLQRLSTLKAYMDNPLDFIDENDKFIDAKKLSELFVEKYKAKGQQLPKDEKLNKEKKLFLKKLIAYLKNKKNLPDSLAVFKDVSDTLLNVQKSDFDVLYAFSEFYNAFIDNLKLPDIIIHAIVYQGPKERLPIVFETLNTSSVSLTKYEVFSSKWPYKKLIIKDNELINKVWLKYEKLTKTSSFNVDITEDTISEEGITLFEYCFGFSEIVGDETKPYSFLFNKTKKSTDPTGFELLALACGLGVNKADDLWKDEYLGNSSGKFLVDLKDALIESITIVSNSLRKWVHDLKDSSIKNTKNYQIYYMIISVFRHLYKVDFTSKSIVKNTDDEWINGFKKHVFKWYLYHQVTNFWNEHRQVTDLKELLMNKQYNHLYSTNISINTWQEALDTFFNDLKENATNRIITNETKLFLNYYYKLMIDEDKNLLKYFEVSKDSDITVIFDIEHIVPVNKFEKFDDELPISALGNLCYLPVKDNRSKRDSTIYEYAKDRPSLTYDTEFLKVIDYPSRTDLSFIDCPYNQFLKPYNDMIEDRQAKMINKFIKLIIK